MNHVTEFFEAAVKHCVSTYGDCSESFNPTPSNEFEARFSQTFDCMLDLNPLTRKKFGVCQEECASRTSWRHGHGYNSKTVVGVSGRRACVDALALLQGRDGERKAMPSVHIGEFLASSDLLHGNALNGFLVDPKLTD